MAEVLKLAEQYAIVAEAERPPTPVRVLKHGDGFAVFDPRGDIVPAQSGEQGFYYAGTRFLSQFELLLANRPPLLLSSTISEDNTVFTADLTNPDVLKGDRVVVARGLLHMFRSRVLANGTWVECLRVTNHALHAIEAPLSFRFEADFADIFEVRGMRRALRGHRLGSTSGRDAVLRYRGLDGVERQTRIRTLREPDQVEEGALSFLVALEPHSSVDFEIAISCESQDTSQTPARFSDTVVQRRQEVAASEQRLCNVLGSNNAFNRWFLRSEADLRMMITETEHGPYPYAGIPWFSTPFGRDGIITALEMLWAVPDVARGVLRFLAETQATTRNDAQDAQPGKILHEMRDGEMAALGEIPFGRYYGSADATPLFVMLADAYFERTGDLAFIDRLWPHLVAALGWLDRDGDPDHDGFIEYARRSEIRARPARLERLVGLGVSRGWHARRASHRALRDPGLRVRGVAGSGAAGGGPRRRRHAPTSGSSERPCCSHDSSRRSGATTSAPTRWRSTPTSSRAVCARRTRDIVSSPASRARITRSVPSRP